MMPAAKNFYIID